MSELRITTDNFLSEVINSDKPVLIDLWAEWCGPCRMLAPVIADIAEEYDGKIKVGKINVDEEPGLAELFGVESIPMVVLVNNGKAEDACVGYRPKEQITAMFKDIIR